MEPTEISGVCTSWLYANTGQVVGRCNRAHDDLGRHILRDGRHGLTLTTGRHESERLVDSRLGSLRLLDEQLRLLKQREANRRTTMEQATRDHDAVMGDIAEMEQAIRAIEESRDKTEPEAPAEEVGPAVGDNPAAES